MIQALIALALVTAAASICWVSVKITTIVYEQNYYLLPKADWDAYVDVRNNEVTNYYRGDQ